MLLALVLKNVAIGMAILVAVLPEFRRSRRRERRPNKSRPEVASSAHPKSMDAALSEEIGDDGFDFLRHPRKLANRSEQIIRGKPSK